MSSSGRNNKKRLARAKVKSTELDSAEKDGSLKPKAAPTKTPAQKRAERKKRITTIVVAVFAVIMALAMMLPSCSAIASNTNSSSSSKSSTSDSSSSSDSSDSSSSSSDSSSSSSSTSSTTSIKKIDANYKTTISALEKKYKKDPDDLATLLNLGNDYMEWGYQVSSYASTDTEKAHVKEVLDKAIDYFDQYLKKNDSDTVKVYRALCQFYEGDTDAALAALQKITQDSPKCALAWANLGLVYESKGDTASAEAAYKKAKKTDPKDEYGAKSFANQRLAVIKAEASASTSTSTTSGTSSTSGTGSGSSSTGLSGALGGLGLSSSN
ncbi:MAG: tetratricopeptide repeat protein [Parafannyhessea sp.]|uniref:tetratricopeptide repeat protein n=1 Tax=Parafannyhessea sp. TaxID=2847324 RepID=UPI003F047BD1